MCHYKLEMKEHSMKERLYQPMLLFPVDMSALRQPSGEFETLFDSIPSLPIPPVPILPLLFRPLSFPSLPFPPLNVFFAPMIKTSVKKSSLQHQWLTSASHVEAAASREHLREELFHTSNQLNLKKISISWESEAYCFFLSKLQYVILWVLGPMSACRSVSLQI